jgi:hypothetical protein
MLLQKQIKGNKMFKTKLEIVSDKKGLFIKDVVVNGAEDIFSHDDWDTGYKIYDYLRGYYTSFRFHDNREIEFKKTDPRVKQYEASDIISREEAIYLLDKMETEIEKLKDILREEHEKRPYFFVSKEF